MARSRVSEAEILYRAGRYEGSVYLVGYAVEYALKGRVATTLLRAGAFPQSNAEFDRLGRLKVHKLDGLLRLSGRDATINRNAAAKAAWEYVFKVWTPELRYSNVGTASANQAQDMIRSVKSLLRVL